MSLLIVGELINTSRKAIKEAVEARNASYIQQVAVEEAKAGADYIDINCGTVVFEEETTIEWLVNTVQDVVKDIPLCMDSPNSKALRAGLRQHRNGQPMINSITAEKERFENVLPLVLEYQAKVVALLMDDSGMPETVEQRIKIVDKLIPDLIKSGIPQNDIYLDPLIKPISTGDQAGQEVLKTVQYIKSKYPDVHTICGLSNVSYGLPNRKVLNHVFTVLNLGMGMDSFILNPTDKQLMGLIFAAQALLGLDRHTMKYLKAYRNGLYE
ncbi:methyltetrahydrofolate cobalamin methyltransferase [Candidatus Formimonas warabiya]|uniref:Methyltetrahydrofolate--corrinoid methyltransferase n=1 Tax=Formimonas warabiya TaxID=1761012 RepID=A0A3G1KQZ8_FORW1|nr:methyltetrahydrofolate cobalamin methyltransferase [Candidatus Formimonas warabiya]ATW24857.1 methyltetrahydrofolate--corrinoid methyltransferase [Candidatus Formimonas warabiya]